MSHRAGKPIRFRVRYKSAEQVLSEFTRSVGKGTVELDTFKSVPVGTKFIFELTTEGIAEGVEVEGEVVSVQPSGERHRLSVRYDPGQRGGLDALLQRVFNAPKFDRPRKYPRVPINVPAIEGAPDAPRLLVRDISRGGVGLEVQSTTLPVAVTLGAPFLLEMSLAAGAVSLYGEVVWMQTSVHPAFGAAFGKLRPGTIERLDRLLTLSELPPSPWQAQVFFGMNAVSRMP